MPARICNSDEFLKQYNNPVGILGDKKLAALGDAYVNFVYSLAMSRKLRQPFGKKVNGTPLAQAVRDAGLRKLLPSRIDKHVLSDAAEALLVFGWLKGALTLEESVETLEKSKDLKTGLVQLLRKTADQIKL